MSHTDHQSQTRALIDQLPALEEAQRVRSQKVLRDLKDTLANIEAAQHAASRAERRSPPGRELERYRQAAVRAIRTFAEEDEQ